MVSTSTLANPSAVILRVASIPSMPRHPHVHHDDVRSLTPGNLDGLGAVGGRADDLQVGLGVQDRGESVADHLLVVGDDRAGHRSAPGVGRLAHTRSPPSGDGSVTRVPPRKAARSRIPARPCPGRSSVRTAPSSSTVIPTSPGR